MIENIGKLSMQNKLAILILAAGASTRMGESKQLLPWKNTTLLGNAIEQALGLTETDVFVVLGSDSERIKDSIKKYPVHVINNDNWQTGMGSSISLGVEVIKNLEVYSKILIHLADQPFVTTKHLKSICNLSFKHENKIIASNYQNKPGVPIVFSAEFFDVFAALKGETGAKKVLRKLEGEVLLLNTIKNLKDVDTKKTYNQLIHSVYVDSEEKKDKKS